MITKEILFAHFEGKTSVLQQRTLEIWLGLAENQQLYYHWLHEWENANLAFQPDLSARERQIMTKIQQPIEAVSDSSSQDNRKGRHVD